MYITTKAEDKCVFCCRIDTCYGGSCLDQVEKDETQDWNAIWLMEPDELAYY